MTKKRATQLIDKSQTGLVEHFEAGVTITTWQEGGKTLYVYKSFGNSILCSEIVNKCYQEMVGEDPADDDEEDEGWKQFTG